MLSLMLQRIALRGPLTLSRVGLSSVLSTQRASRTFVTSQVRWEPARSKVTEDGEEVATPKRKRTVKTAATTKKTTTAKKTTAKKDAKPKKVKKAAAKPPSTSPSSFSPLFPSPNSRFNNELLTLLPYASPLQRSPSKATNRPNVRRLRGCSSWGSARRRRGRRLGRSRMLMRL